MLEAMCCDSVESPESVAGSLAMPSTSCTPAMERKVMHTGNGKESHAHRQWKGKSCTPAMERKVDKVQMLCCLWRFEQATQARRRLGKL
uniref:Uncharacterized protein n=1 Tax=Manihot esculenta TaxID=3983 RepID=A0A2C9U9J9_MANES